MTVRILTISLLLSIPAFASAQSVEVFATTGVIQLWDDDGNIGVGVPIGGGVGLKWPGGWGIEALAETQKAGEPRSPREATAAVPASIEKYGVVEFSGEFTRRFSTDPHPVRR